MHTFASSIATPPPLPTPSRRKSLFITALVWVFITLGTVLLPVSAITLLMIVAGSHGTVSTSLSGFLLVVGGPPATVLAGIGLMRRWRWAYACSLVLLVSVTWWHLAILVRGPIPEHTYTTASGVRTTVLASNINYPAHLAALAIVVGIFLKLATRAVRTEFGYARQNSLSPQPLP